MRKPNNFEKVQAQGEYIPVELGGHYLEIKEVLEMQSRNGKEMIKVSFDFAKDDKQPGYFAESFRNDIRPDKKWPHQGTAYVVTEDDDGNCSRSFKTFITCVEKSNNGFETRWGSDFGKQFENKRVGGVFGPVKDFYNGKIRDKRELRWFSPVDKVEEARIPDVLETQEYKNHAEGYAPGSMPASDGFMTVPDGIDEELPFD